ncbi:Thermosome subunit beta (Fragment) [Seminavis robusta]|uniref:T-complex protein 1 subunit delta n=1 Tax=Seminavis robusta TaxID=568900 RepID=A0A9N8EQC3_9STRA
MASASVSQRRSGETLGDNTKGRDVRISNIVAAKAIATAIRTSLGPRGMDKLLTKGSGEVIISNDGATILKNMQVLHPAAQMLVDLSQSQDIEAGDGTTTVVVLAGALLEACATLLAKGIHPTVIAQSFLLASEKTCEILKEMSRPVLLTDRQALLNAVETCLSSKVVAQNSDLLAPIAVDSVLGLLGVTPSTSPEDIPSNVDLRDIRIVQQVGGTVDDTELVTGLVLNAPKINAPGAPTVIQNAKIALIQFCLSAPKTDMDNTVVVEDYSAMDRLLREERKYILGQCKALKKSGANVVLIQKSILRDAYNELSLHFLAKMGIMVLTDIDRGDVPFICKTLGCSPIAHIDQLASKTSSKYFGTAEKVTHVYLEGASHRVVKFTGVPPATAPTQTILLRGSNSLVLGEAERSLHDAQCVVRSLVKQRALIAGGGAPEAQASYALEQHAKTLQGMAVPCFKAFADALEVIPYTLAENAGLKPIEVVTQLRKLHAEGNVGAGVDVVKNKKIKTGTTKVEGVSDMYERNVVQPLSVSTSAVTLATETVCMILKVDDMIVVQ